MPYPFKIVKIYSPPNSAVTDNLSETQPSLPTFRPKDFNDKKIRKKKGMIKKEKSIHINKRRS